LATSRISSLSKEAGDIDDRVIHRNRGSLQTCSIYTESSTFLNSDDVIKILNTFLTLLN